MTVDSVLSLWRVTGVVYSNPVTYHIFVYSPNRHMSDMILDAVSLLWRITFLVYSSIPVTCHIFVYTPSLSHNRCLVVSILSVTCHMCYFLYPSHLSDMSFTFLSLWRVILLSLWRVTYLFTSPSLSCDRRIVDSVLSLWCVRCVVSSNPVTYHIFVYSIPVRCHIFVYTPIPVTCQTCCWLCPIIVTCHMCCLFSYPCDISNICLLPYTFHVRVYPVLSFWHVTCVVYSPSLWGVTYLFTSPIPVTCQTCCWLCPIIVTCQMRCLFFYLCDVSHICLLPHPCHMSDMTLDAVLLLWRVTCVVYSSIPVTCHIFVYTPSLSHNRCLVVSILSVTCHMCYFLYPSHLSDMSFTFLSLWRVILLSLTYPCHMSDMTLDAVLSSWRITYLVYSSIPVTCHIFVYSPSLSHVRHDTWCCLIIVTYHMCCLLPNPCDISHICLLPNPCDISHMLFTPLSLWCVTYIVYFPIPVTYHIFVYSPIPVTDHIFVYSPIPVTYHIFVYFPHPCHITDVLFSLSYHCYVSHVLFTPPSLWRITYLFTPKSLWHVTYLFTPLYHVTGAGLGWFLVT